MSKEDSLTMLKGYAAQSRDLQAEISSIEERLAEKKAELSDLHNVKMPALMDELQLDNIGAPPKGNLPGIDFKLVQQISASIAAGWDEKKKGEAFDVLKKYKAESLIKTEVSAKLPKGSLKVAKQLVADARKRGVTAELKQSVHAGTLSAWVREIYEGGQTLPQSDLEKIGGYIGRVVKAEVRDE
jgi:hypothetical protein